MIESAVRTYITIQLAYFRSMIKMATLSITRGDGTVSHSILKNRLFHHDVIANNING